MKASVFIGVLVLTVSTAVYAQPADLKAQKHAVTRFYQAYFGPAERCKTADPEIAQALKLTLDSIRLTYPNAIQLVMDSPHFNQAKIDFQNTKRDSDLKSLNSWCSEHHSLIKWLFQSESSPELVANLVDVISK
jgi:hypothetical protein